MGVLKRSEPHFLRSGEYNAQSSDSHNVVVLVSNIYNYGSAQWHKSETFSAVRKRLSADCRSGASQRRQEKNKVTGTVLFPRVLQGADAGNLI